MLPIKFKKEVSSKIEDAKLLQKAKEQKKVANKSNSIIDIIERIRIDVETYLGDEKSKYQCIRDKKTFLDYIEKANKFGKIAVDTETTGLDPMEVDIVGLCLYFPGEPITYVPINHKDYITGERLQDQLNENDIREGLEQLKAKIIMHNAQFDIRILKHTCKVILKCWWDTQIGATLLDENEIHKLKYLHEKYISHKEEKTFADLFNGIDFPMVPIMYAYLYGAHDAIDTYELQEYQEQFINNREDNSESNKKIYSLFTTIEMPMVDVIVDLEDNGVAVDMEVLDSLKEKYHKKLDESLQLCYDELNAMSDQIEAYKKKNPNHKLEDPINIGSSDQLVILFYEILKAKSGLGKKKYSVDKDVMKILAKDYPIAKYILDYRAASKITSTYVDNIYEIIKKDGRVHTHFNSNGAKTGRMSSSDPLNLQNIPSHNQDIRKMFVGQTTYRDVEKREDNAYILKREEEVEMQDGTWKWAEAVQKGDVLSDGSIVKVVKIKDFKVLIGV